MTDFQLIETMRVLPSGEVYLLDRHLERLRRSARFFGFKCDLPNVQDKILQALPNDGNPLCLRLTLSEEGAVRLQRGPLPVGHAKHLRLSRIRVDSSDMFLYHKTTHRAIYDAAGREWDSETDSILMNERDEITETTIMNIAVFRDGRWSTPPVTSGLLCGVMREELLARGEIAEGIIPANELRDGELIRGFNALRGVCEIVFRAMSDT